MTVQNSGGPIALDIRRRQPIFVTPVHRRNYQKNGKLTEELRPYADAMKAVAEEKKVPVVDLFARSGELFEKVGEAGGVDLNCSPNDHTHFSEKGARAVAELVLQGLREVCPRLAAAMRVKEALDPKTQEAVLRNRRGGYDEQFCSDPKVFRDGDHWVMFYFGVGRGGAHIMVAFSRDLLHWTAHPEPLYKAGGNPSGLDKQYAHKISLVYNPANDTFLMFYNAVPGKKGTTGGRGIGLISSRPLAADGSLGAGGR